MIGRQTARNMMTDGDDERQMMTQWQEMMKQRQIMNSNRRWCEQQERMMKDEKQDDPHRRLVVVTGRRPTQRGHDDWQQIEPKNQSHNEEQQLESQDHTAVGTTLQPPASSNSDHGTNTIPKTNSRALPLDSYLPTSSFLQQQWRAHDRTKDRW